MQNDTYQLPDQQDQGPKLNPTNVEGSVESTQSHEQDQANITENYDSILGLGRAVSQLNRNLDREEFLETSTLETRELVDFGAEIELEREAFRNDVEEVA